MYIQTHLSLYLSIYLSLALSLSIYVYICIYLYLYLSLSLYIYIYVIKHIPFANERFQVRPGGGALPLSFVRGVLNYTNNLKILQRGGGTYIYIYIHTHSNIYIYIYIYTIIYNNGTYIN